MNTNNGSYTGRFIMNIDPFKQVTFASVSRAKLYIDGAQCSFTTLNITNNKTMQFVLSCSSSCSQVDGGYSEAAEDGAVNGVTLYFK